MMHFLNSNPNHRTFKIFAKTFLLFFAIVNILVFFHFHYELNEDHDCVICLFKLALKHTHFFINVLILVLYGFALFKIIGVFTHKVSLPLNLIDSRGPPEISYL